MPPAQNLQINPQRLWDTLMETAQFGATAKGGICRLTLTDLDRKVRDWFKARCEALGCTVSVDEVGNMFARRPGRNNTLSPIAMGSHLDTQPTGGKFDGVLGVLGALEALRTLPKPATKPTRRSRSSTGPTRKARALRRRCWRPACSPACSRRITLIPAPIATAKLSATSSTRIGYRGAEKAGSRKFCADVRTAHRAGPDPRRRAENDRHCARRARHALVRSHGHRPGGPHRRHADAASQERAPRRRPHDRADRRDRARARAGRGRHRRHDREQAEQPQCRAGRSVLHHRFPPPRRQGARRHGAETARVACRNPQPPKAHLRGKAHLGFAGR